MFGPIDQGRSSSLAVIFFNGAQSGLNACATFVLPSTRGGGLGASRHRYGFPVRGELVRLLRPRAPAIR